MCSLLLLRNLVYISKTASWREVRVAMRIIFYNTTDMYAPDKLTLRVWDDPDFIPSKGDFVAAKLIAERRPETARAGLSGDWIVQHRVWRSSLHVEVYLSKAEVEV